MSVLPTYRARAEFTLRIVDEDESRALNKRWRGVDRPTNVLSFRSEGLDDLNPELLGDVVICAPLARQEADDQCKRLDAHWAHLMVHGILHLLGFHHGTDRAAKEMEAIERAALADLGFEDPYVVPERQ